jgi:hypothetical protein
LRRWARPRGSSFGTARSLAKSFQQCFGGSYFFFSALALTACVRAHSTQKTSSCLAMYGYAVVLSVRFGSAGRQSRLLHHIFLFSRWQNRGQSGLARTAGSCALCVVDSRRAAPWIRGSSQLRPGVFWVLHDFFLFVHRSTTLRNIVGHGFVKVRRWLVLRQCASWSHAERRPGFELHLCAV